MKFSVNFISLITIFILPKNYSLTTRPVPGSSGCVYYGAITEYCDGTTVPVSDLPKECTSFFYLAIFADESQNVTFEFSAIVNEEYVNSLLCTQKPTFLYYSHGDAIAFMAAIRNKAENAKIEMKNLKAFLEPYKTIAGLVLQYITPGVDVNDTSCYTDNFKAYISEMRASLPNYSIGVEIEGRTLIDFQNQECAPIWLDFAFLDSCIDFYVVSVYQLNDCTEEFKVGGASPLNGTAHYTVEIVYDLVIQLGIPAEKIYFLFAPGPTVEDDIFTCSVRSILGAYAKQYGAGFIVKDVDVRDDSDGSCECEYKYTGFYDMLAGFNGDPVPPACALLDKS